MPLLQGIFTVPDNQLVWRFKQKKDAAAAFGPHCAIRNTIYEFHSSHYTCRTVDRDTYRACHIDESQTAHVLSLFERDAPWDLDITVTKLQCQKCKQVKEATSGFSPRPNVAAGFHHTCNECLPNPDGYRKTVSPTSKINDIRRGAAKRSMAFNDKEMALMRAKLEEPCVYCGHLTPGQLGGLDRIDSALGYCDANTVACCSHCNYIKKDFELDEFKAGVLTIAEHNPDIGAQPLPRPPKPVQSCALKSRAGVCAIQAKYNRVPCTCCLCGTKREDLPDKHMSVIRKDPKKAYEPGNVEPCCPLCNLMCCAIDKKWFVQHVHVLATRVSQWSFNVSQVREKVAAIAGDMAVPTFESKPPKKPPKKPPRAVQFSQPCSPFQVLAKFRSVAECSDVLGTPRKAINNYLKKGTTSMQKKHAVHWRVTAINPQDYEALVVDPSHQAAFVQEFRSDYAKVCHMPVRDKSLRRVQAQARALVARMLASEQHATTNTFTTNATSSSSTAAAASSSTAAAASSSTAAAAAPALTASGSAGWPDRVRAARVRADSHMDFDEMEEDELASDPDDFDSLSDPDDFDSLSDPDDFDSLSDPDDFDFFATSPSSTAAAASSSTAAAAPSSTAAAASSSTAAAAAPALTASGSAGWPDRVRAARVRADSHMDFDEMEEDELASDPDDFDSLSDPDDFDFFATSPSSTAAAASSSTAAAAPSSTAAAAAPALTATAPTLMGTLPTRNHVPHKKQTKVTDFFTPSPHTPTHAAKALRSKRTGQSTLPEYFSRSSTVPIHAPVTKPFKKSTPSKKKSRGDSQSTAKAKNKQRIKK